MSDSRLYAFNADQRLARVARAGGPRPAAFPNS